MKYFLFFILLGFSIMTMAQTATQSNSGNWNVAGNWDVNNIGNTLAEAVTINQNVSSTIINGDNYTIGSLTLDKSTLTINTGGNLVIGSASQPGFFISDQNVTLIVNGDLEIFGPFTVKNNLNLIITGNFIIRGDIEVKNGAGFNVEGDLIIEGNFVGGNNATFNVDGSIDVAGDLTIGMSPGLTYGPDGTFSVGGTCTGPVSFCSALPVTLISFNAYSQESGVSLHWVTASEINNDYYTLQVSSDGVEFRDIANVQGRGNSTTESKYSFLDSNPLPNVSYYRLSQTDYDRTRVVFDPIRVDRLQLQQPLIYPNPVQTGNLLNVYTGGGRHDVSQLEVLTLQGVRVWNKTLTGVQHAIDLSSSLPAGIYLLQLSSGETRISRRLVVE